MQMPTGSYYKGFWKILDSQEINLFEISFTFDLSALSKC